jgi:hypothetical protein
VVVGKILGLFIITKNTQVWLDWKSIDLLIFKVSVTNS